MAKPRFKWLAVSAEAFASRWEANSNKVSNMTGKRFITLSLSIILTQTLENYCAIY
jgi:hypothetical protein